MGGGGVVINLEKEASFTPIKRVGGGGVRGRKCIAMMKKGVGVAFC